MHAERLESFGDGAGSAATGAEYDDDPLPERRSCRERLQVS
jgi:hypothetical protein